MLKQFPWPKNWQDFERLCHGLWSQLWGDPAAQLHGRSGQSQHGVDIFGRLPERTRWGGVQCKGRDHYPPSSLTRDELELEVRKALGFSPPLSEFILATVSPRDVSIQAAARLLTADQERQGLFSVTVWSWDDISEELSRRPLLVERFYPEYTAPAPSTPHRQDGDVSFAVFATEPRAAVRSAFSHPEVIASIGEAVRADMEIAVLELILNALEHGGATRAEVSISRERVEIRDNGRFFNPVRAEPALRDGRGAGLLFFKKFCDKYKDVMRPGYRVEALENVLEMTFDVPLQFMTQNRSCMYFVPGRVLSGGGDRLAEAVPIESDCEVFTCVFERDLYALSASFLFVFLRTLVHRLPSGCVLVVDLPSETDLMRHTIEDLSRRDADLASRIRVAT